MAIVEGPLFVEPVKEHAGPRSQPIDALPQGGAPLDDAAVREAIGRAESAGQDPLSLSMADLAQGQSQNPVSAEAHKVAPMDVPQKFLKPDGGVDVEKLQTSTRQLDEAIKEKETAIAAVQKTTEDYLRDYRAMESHYSGLPNAERLAAQVPVQPPPQMIPPSQMSEQQLQELINRDMRENPAATVAQLIDIAIQKRLEPIESDRKVSQVRGNIEALAKNDPRVLDTQIYDAIKAKLNQDPDLWKLKNPHKAAWLEVKEELRLGDLPKGGQAQPSKTLSPVLGGGTPPSTPSSSVARPQDIIANLGKLDLRDKSQEAAGDEAIRALFSGRT